MLGSQGNVNRLLVFFTRGLANNREDKFEISICTLRYHIRHLIKKYKLLTVRKAIICVFITNKTANKFHIILRFSCF